MPTPGGVPVEITSPGCRLMNWLTVADQLRHAEDHGLGAAVLVAVAVDLEPHVEVLRVGDLVRGHQPGADRAEGVAALALVPLAAALDLEVALGDVVDDAIAGDVVHRVGFGDVAGLLADDDAEFDFPVGLDRARAG